MEIRKVILSRSRSNSVTTHNVIHGCTLTVCETQFQEYEENYDLPIIVHPDDVDTLGKLRNWLRDYYPDDCIVMLDDDIESVRTLGIISNIRLTPEQVDSLIYSTANTAYELGVKAFGWNQNGNVIAYNPADPFTLSKWIGTAIGVFPDCQRWDEEIKTKCDLDFSLKELMVNRIIFRDNRFFFNSDRDSKIGGNQEYKSSEQVQRDKDYLKDKWGKYVRFTKSVKGKSESTTVKVPRKQQLIIR